MEDGDLRAGLELEATVRSGIAETHFLDFQQTAWRVAVETSAEAVTEGGIDLSTIVQAYGCVLPISGVMPPCCGWWAADGAAAV